MGNDFHESGLQIVTIHPNENDLNETQTGYLNVDTGDVFVTPPPIMCESCNENEAGDYTVGDHRVCPRCVRDAQGYMYARYVLDNIGDYNDILARAVGILEQADREMRRVNIPYVDMLSDAKDCLESMSEEDARDMFAATFDTVVHSTRQPGTVM